LMLCVNVETTTIPYLRLTTLDHGVKFADGDGSVPLLSMGYLCVDGWKRKEFNPSGAKVVTREYSPCYQESGS
jgi:hypothetical protein